MASAHWFDFISLFCRIFADPLFIIAFFNSFFLTFLLEIFKAYGIDPVKPSLQQDCCLRTGALISFRSVSCVLHHKTGRSTLLLPFSNIILGFLKLRRGLKITMKLPCCFSSLSVIKKTKSIYPRVML